MLPSRVAYSYLPATLVLKYKLLMTNNKLIINNIYAFSSHVHLIAGLYSNQQIYDNDLIKIVNFKL